MYLSVCIYVYVHSCICLCVYHHVCIRACIKGMCGFACVMRVSLCVIMAQVWLKLLQRLFTFVSVKKSIIFKGLLISIYIYIYILVLGLQSPLT